MMPLIGESLDFILNFYSSVRPHLNLYIITENAIEGFYSKIIYLFIYLFIYLLFFVPPISVSSVCFCRALGVEYFFLNWICWVPT